ncbi:MAG: hypothetical protein MJZ21_04770 [archaeon]|nr:hypothetical protein [archaeon]
MLIAFSPFIGDFIGRHFLDTTNIWYLAFLLSFVCCYNLAYIRGEFEMMYVAVHVISSKRFPNGATLVKPIVYYYGDDGNLYAQKQSFREILKTVFLGIRSRLDFPMNDIKRTAPMCI